VTLVCEDGEQVEAHRVILAVLSPLFQRILKRNNHPHPMIYLRGLKSQDLVAMIDFLYFGEADVSQESLDSFLALAEEMELKGLTGQKAADLFKVITQTLNRSKREMQLERKKNPNVDLQCHI